MPPEWNLHYDDWIIGDGEPDRHVGEIFDWFAVAFWTKARLTKVPEGSRSVALAADHGYRIVAEVTYLSDSACIIDFGFKVTTTDDILPPGCQRGDYVTGDLYLRLPLCTEVGPEEPFKALAHRWQVRRISADVTPYVAHPDNPRFFMRDESQVRYEEVPATFTVKARTYILHCCEVSMSA
jgi:hypothetical protein